MWKLTIIRKYKKAFLDGDTLDMEAVFEYESVFIEDLVSLVERTQKQGVNGTYEYSIVYVKKGEQE